MRQTVALLIDSYRELQSRKLIWIVLVISGVLVLACAMLSIDASGISFLKWRIGDSPLSTAIMSKGEFYELLFDFLGVNIWLTWGALILALISTASIIPEFLAGGSIELFVSKPINRARLFLTKYAGALLFVAVQVTIFCGASFLMIGIRGGEWRFRVFLGVPLVTCVFSYLYCVSALIGVISRSTIGALIVVLVFWAALWLISTADVLLLSQSHQKSMALSFDQHRLVDLRGRATALGASHSPVDAMQKAYIENQIAGASGRIASDQSTLDSLNHWQGLMYDVETVLPKTSQTTQIMSRSLSMDQRLNGGDASMNSRNEGDYDPQSRREERAGAGRAAAKDLSQRSPWWIIGTSLIFEAVILTLTAWKFARQDY